MHGKDADRFRYLVNELLRSGQAEDYHDACRILARRAARSRRSRKFHHPPIAKPNPPTAKDPTPKAYWWQND